MEISAESILQNVLFIDIFMEQLRSVENRYGSVKFNAIMQFYGNLVNLALIQVYSSNRGSI